MLNNITYTLRFVCRFGAICFYLLLCPSLLSESTFDLPIAIDAKVVKINGSDDLVVTVKNISSGRVDISTDFLNTCYWEVTALEESSDGKSFKLRQLVPKTYKSGGAARQDKINFIKHRVADAINITSIESGYSYEISIPLEQALRTAKLSQPLDFPIIVQLGFSNVLLSVPGVNDTEMLELYLSRFHTPRFILRGEKWMPF